MRRLGAAVAVMMALITWDGDDSPRSSDWGKFMYDDRPRYTEACPVLYHPKISYV